MGITFPVLAMMGFDAHAKSGTSGLVGLQAMFTLVPAGLALAASAIISSYKLTSDGHSEVRAGVDAHDKAEAAHDLGRRGCLHLTDARWSLLANAGLFGGPGHIPRLSGHRNRTASVCRESLGETTGARTLSHLFRGSAWRTNVHPRRERKRWESTMPPGQRW
jgi:hypothetical protein